MPPEIVWLEVGSYLSPTELWQLCSVNTKFRNYCKEKGFLDKAKKQLMSHILYPESKNPEKTLMTRINEQLFGVMQDTGFDKIRKDFSLRKRDMTSKIIKQTMLDMIYEYIGHTCLTEFITTKKMNKSCIAKVTFIKSALDAGYPEFLMMGYSELSCASHDCVTWIRKKGKLMDFAYNKLFATPGIFMKIFFKVVSSGIKITGYDSKIVTLEYPKGHVFKGIYTLPEIRKIFMSNEYFIYGKKVSK